jgi:uncharacterized membrane protein
MGTPTTQTDHTVTVHQEAVMTFDPLLAAPAIVQLHVAGALAALVVGPLAWARRQRDIWHKGLGRLWVGTMAVVALSSFGIHDARVIGPFSPIHLLSVLVLWSLWQGVAAARAGQRADHAQTMRALYVWGLVVPGVFTLLPRQVDERDAVFRGPGRGLCRCRSACVGRSAGAGPEARPGGAGPVALNCRDPSRISRRSAQPPLASPAPCSIRPPAY